MSVQFNENIKNKVNYISYQETLSKLYRDPVSDITNLDELEKQTNYCVRRKAEDLISKSGLNQEQKSALYSRLRTHFQSNKEYEVKIKFRLFCRYDTMKNVINNTYSINEDVELSFEEGKPNTLFALLYCATVKKTDSNSVDDARYVLPLVKINVKGVGVLSCLDSIKQQLKVLFGLLYISGLCKHRKNTLSDGLLESTLLNFEFEDKRAGKINFLDENIEASILLKETIKYFQGLYIDYSDIEKESKKHQVSTCNYIEKSINNYVNLSRKLLNSTYNKKSKIIGQYKSRLVSTVSRAIAWVEKLKMSNTDEMAVHLSIILDILSSNPAKNEASSKGNNQNEVALRIADSIAIDYREHIVITQTLHNCRMLRNGYIHGDDCGVINKKLNKSCLSELYKLEDNKNLRSCVCSITEYFVIRYLLKQINLLP